MLPLHYLTYMKKTLVFDSKNGAPAQSGPFVSEKNGVSSLKWSDYEKLTTFPGPAAWGIRHVRKGTVRAVI